MTRTEPVSTVPTLLQRVVQLTKVVLAMRVYRWCNEWPRGHADRPQVPAFVRNFEAEHGPAPASAERILDAFRP